MVTEIRIKVRVKTDCEEAGGNSRVVEMTLILTGAAATWLLTLIKTHQIVY